MQKLRFEDCGVIYAPKEPTLKMLEAGYAALEKLYPPEKNGGSAIGQHIVWEVMLRAAYEELGAVRIELDES